jgi:hypothetical protein
MKRVLTAKNTEKKLSIISEKLCVFCGKKNTLLHKSSQNQKFHLHLHLIYMDNFVRVFV